MADTNRVSVYFPDDSAKDVQAALQRFATANGWSQSQAAVFALRHGIPAARAALREELSAEL